MSFCSNCGTRLEGYAQACPNCGIPVRRQQGEPYKPRNGSSRIFLVIALIFLGIAIIIAVIFSFPVKKVNVDKTRNVEYQDGIDFIDLDFSSDVADVKLKFDDLSNDLITLKVNGSGFVGVLGSEDVVEITFEHAITGDRLQVTSEVNASRGWRPERMECEIAIDRSLAASLNINVNTGGVEVVAGSGVVLTEVNIVANTGGIQADLANGVTLSGDMSVSTNTGGIDLSWDNINVGKDLNVDLDANTGGIQIDIKQTSDISADVTFNADTNTGGIDFAIEIKGDVGAQGMISTGALGSPSVNLQGFDFQVDWSDSEDLLKSDNYPAGHNFDITLDTNLGAVDIEAKYTP
jgi:hypothetical protein